MAKSDLDIVSRVKPADFSVVETELAARFQRNEGSVRATDFAAFEDATARPHLGVQLTAKGGPFDMFHRFGEALRASPDLVVRYNDLKLKHEGRTMAEYREAKDEFIAEVLSKSP